MHDRFSRIFNECRSVRKLLTKASKGKKSYEENWMKHDKGIGINRGAGPKQLQNLFLTTNANN